MQEKSDLLLFKGNQHKKDLLLFRSKQRDSYHYDQIQYLTLQYGFQAYLFLSPSIFLSIEVVKNLKWSREPKSRFQRKIGKFNFNCQSDRRVLDFHIVKGTYS